MLCKGLHPINSISLRCDPSHSHNCWLFSQEPRQNTEGLISREKRWARNAHFPLFSGHVRHNKKTGTFRFRFSCLLGVPTPHSSLSSPSNHSTSVSNQDDAPSATCRFWLLVVCWLSGLPVPTVSASDGVEAMHANATGRTRLGRRFMTWISLQRFR